ncbi:thiamine pyrophosphate-dependent enzyme [Nonomuraea sp. KM88]|uniref:thiamine pyrophosphate-dependent enzyme n=1 Tax=Nonomuraea sp. KM88 TaxID=3457427 RepID=UPI003FCE367A
MVTGAPERPKEGIAHVRELMAIVRGDAKHADAAESTADALWVLYDRILRLSPDGGEERDRFYLSKGHGPMAYYAVLAIKGFIDPAELYRFGTFHSMLGHHPDRIKVPGIDISSGSLGHGLPLAVGSALGLRALGRQGRVWVLMGDGELDEGSNAEAIAYAGRTRLDALHVVLIDNHSATQGWPGGLEERFRIEGWSCARVDGRNHQALEDAYREQHGGRPRLVVANVRGSREARS